MLRNTISDLQEENSLLQTNRLINNQKETSSLEKLKQYADYYQKQIAELETSIYDTNVSLSAKESQIKTFSYEIRHPKNKQVNLN